ncbi:MAG: aminotransferase class V-fold PLP-dependent enzyme [Chloroflexi bacterium]|nr:aminotransferase class V-fold PLP-dependent enzyme [Chloroflexota bacterium]
MTADIYERLGVRKIINAYGTLTTLGGSLMASEVVDAMAEASRHFVDLSELLTLSGAHIARLIGVEAACITSGAAAGLALATAACVAGSDRARIERLPDTTGMPNRVAIHRDHRNGFDQAVRQAGIELVEFGGTEPTQTQELAAVLDDRTAAVVYFVCYAGANSPSLEAVLETAHAQGIPVIVDAAAELPPLTNLSAFTDLGADLVIFSGGKDIEGPQCTGLIVGRHDLVQACALNANPNQGIGRPMKVGKEEIVGLVVALERYLGQDRQDEDARWERQVAHLLDVLQEIPGVTARRVVPTGPGVRPTIVPRGYVCWDPNVIRITVEDVVHHLWTGRPAIAIGNTTDEHHAAETCTHMRALVFNPQVLTAGEERIVAERIAAILRMHTTTG